MNHRLVELVAQTILAMSEEERQLLENRLQLAANSPQNDEFEDLDESFLIAEIARDLQTPKEPSDSPLSALPAEQWAIEESDASVSATFTEGAPPPKEYLCVAPSRDLEGSENWPS